MYNVYIHVDDLSDRLCLGVMALVGTVCWEEVVVVVDL
jgi:hypothetical protein